jgi:hypothetical protein
MKSKLSFVLRNAQLNAHLLKAEIYYLTDLIKKSVKQLKKLK